MGQLAGGVAHDFNNLITIITGYSELLRKALEGNPELQTKAEEIYKAGEQANSLTRQLLAFSRRQMLQTHLLDLTEILRDMESILRRLLSEDIELTILADTGLGLIRSDRGQIEQVIMNLVINARDAMPQGGKLALIASRLELDERRARTLPGIDPGSYVRLTVQDTGCGMDTATQARIFEPFFTTKEQGKGTGLGLATVYGIVQQAGGHITVESEPGKGSTFQVYFPRVEGTASRPLEVVDEPPAFGSETVLLVEDQEGLRSLLVEILQRHGYSVLPAANGRDALMLAHRHQGRIDLMITDLIMPRMGGRELAERLLQSRPAMKVLYMSGYSEKGFVLAPGQMLLAKPFHPETLLRKARELLDRLNQTAHSA
jgi:two-component system cell cycle sensor histidine kinase/response regulator CckA